MMSFFRDHILVGQMITTDFRVSQVQSNACLNNLDPSYEDIPYLHSEPDDYNIAQGFCRRVVVLGTTSRQRAADLMHSRIVSTLQLGYSKPTKNLQASRSCDDGLTKWYW